MLSSQYFERNNCTRCLPIRRSACRLVTNHSSCLLSMRATCLDSVTLSDLPPTTHCSSRGPKQERPPAEAVMPVSSPLIDVLSSLPQYQVRQVARPPVDDTRDDRENS